MLFLDEPTSGLDPTNARILKDIILEQKQMGKTIILTTHNMHDAQELCDRVSFIVDGKIAAIDTPHALRKSKADTKVEFEYVSGNSEVSRACLLSELGTNAEFMKAIREKSLKNIHSKEQTLEDVFIQLTGRRLD